VAAHRRRLKTELWLQGIHECMSWPYYTVRPELARPICPWCGLTIDRPEDCVMHEWLIRRAALPVKRQLLIMHPYNVVLCHVWCHAQHETTEKFKRQCAKAQYRAHGRDKIVAWASGLNLKFAVWIPEPEEEE